MPAKKVLIYVRDKDNVSKLVADSINLHEKSIGGSKYIPAIKDDKIVINSSNLINYAYLMDKIEDIKSMESKIAREAAKNGNSIFEASRARIRIVSSAIKGWELNHPYDTVRYLLYLSYLVDNGRVNIGNLNDDAIYDVVFSNSKEEADKVGFSGWKRYILPLINTQEVKIYGIINNKKYLDSLINFIKTKFENYENIWYKSAKIVILGKENRVRSKKVRDIDEVKIYEIDKNDIRNLLRIGEILNSRNYDLGYLQLDKDQCLCYVKIENNRKTLKWHPYIGNYLKAWLISDISYQFLSSKKNIEKPEEINAPEFKLRYIREYEKSKRFNMSKEVYDKRIFSAIAAFNAWGSSIFYDLIRNKDYVAHGVLHPFSLFILDTLIKDGKIEEFLDIISNSSYKKSDIANYILNHMINVVKPENLNNVLELFAKYQYIDKFRNILFSIPEHIQYFSSNLAPLVNEKYSAIASIAPHVFPNEEGVFASDFLNTIFQYSPSVEEILALNLEIENIIAKKVFDVNKNAYFDKNIYLIPKRKYKKYFDMDESFKENKELIPYEQLLNFSYKHPNLTEKIWRNELDVIKKYPYKYYLDNYANKNNLNHRFELIPSESISKELIPIISSIVYELLNKDAKEIAHRYAKYL